MTESMRNTVARRLTTRQHWDKYKQASLLLSVKLLLLPDQLVPTKILMRNLQASQCDWYPKCREKGT
jgi:hypothetical protein